MTFLVTPDVVVGRDASGVVRWLRHIQAPYSVARGPASRSARALADAYLSDVAHLFAIDAKAMSASTEEVGGLTKNEGSRLHFSDEKTIQETTVVSWFQTHAGLPVYRAGVSVTVYTGRLLVPGGESWFLHDIKVRSPSPEAPYLPERLTGKILLRLLGLHEPKSKIEKGKPTKKRARRAAVTIDRARALIYRYDPARRAGSSVFEGREPPEHARHPDTLLRLPALPAGVEPGSDHVVTEALFTLSRGGGSQRFRVFIEAQSGAVLLLDALSAGMAQGSVFKVDPVTATGDIALALDATTLSLGDLTTERTEVSLSTDIATELHGLNVYIGDVSPPATVPPVLASAASKFDYYPNTDNFAAVNAYHHLDQLFGMMSDMGFQRDIYFDGVANPPGVGFPIRVDHRGTPPTCGSSAGNCFGAYTYPLVVSPDPGNVSSTGVASFAFALTKVGGAVGIACDSRVVAHEFCHALLLDHLHSIKFEFAHSAGDGLAAVLHDPGSLAPDRGLTFPSICNNVAFSRRHDRNSWIWMDEGNTIYNTDEDPSQVLQDDSFGYLREQIVSTILFRLYLALGGSSTNPEAPRKLAAQMLASRYVTYLIFQGIGGMGSLGNTPETFANALMYADTQKTTFSYTGPTIRGGAVHKVVQWAFAEQGRPVIPPGVPYVDVYIDDGRAGGYAYQEVFWNTQDIWNRHAPADSPDHEHEAPWLDTPNYAFVRVKNRGTSPATGVVVYAYHCKPTAGTTWPDDWKSMTTASLPLAAPLFPGDFAIVGPFEWTPTAQGHECMMMSVSAPGDRSNIDMMSGLACAVGPTPDFWLVPFDNNIAQRNVAPVPAPVTSALSNALDGRTFTVANPFPTSARATLRAVFPEALARRGFALAFTSPGGASFTLGPRASREVMIKLVRPAGEDSAKKDTSKRERGPEHIHVELAFDDIVVGGVSFLLDPRLEKAPSEHAPLDRRHRAAAQRVLDALGLDTSRIVSVTPRRILIAIDLDVPPDEEDCEDRK